MQWQLMHSSYHNFGAFPARPNPAAVEGQIVHSVLEKLFKTFIIEGLPRIATLHFKRVVANVDIRGTIRVEIENHKKQINSHPRGAAFSIKSNQQQLSNKVVRLFKSIYPQLRKSYTKKRLLKKDISSTAKLIPDQNPLNILKNHGAISELKLYHQELCFTGIIDLIWYDSEDIVISDFKTGTFHSEYKEQLLFYAVLWWKATGTMPKRLEVCYPDKIDSFSLKKEQIVENENSLKSRISHATKVLSDIPATANVDKDCKFCDVRQFCDSYWEQVDQKFNESLLRNHNGKNVDVKLEVAGQPSEYGFEAVSSIGVKISVVYESGLLKVHGPFLQHKTVCILNGRVKNKGKELELKPWTEVFRH